MSIKFTVLQKLQNMNDGTYETSLPLVNSTWSINDETNNYHDARTWTMVSLALFIVIPLIGVIIFLKRTRRCNACMRCCIRGMASPM